ncbi:MAG: DUF4831 family protein [Muribaculum sp.]|nr:DUF4831 family protein [Muribaculum sp.]
MKKTVIALACSVGIAGGLSAQTTQKFTATKANDYGLVYSLPVTVLDITVEAERVVKKPGEFYKYAKKYLNVDNPVAEPSESWSVKQVIVNARGVADNDNRYLMEFKGGFSPFLIMDENNLPLAINYEDVEVPDSPVLPELVKAAPTPLETSAARQVVSEEMLQSQSSAKRAELAAQRIYELRQSRNDLITGQADQMPPDGAAMQLVMDQIAAQEAALTAMFVGTEQHSTAVRTFTYVPGDAVKNHVIARISAFDGIVDASDLSGDPVMLTLKVTSRGEMPVNEKGEEKAFPKGGVAYCIPGTASLEIDYNGKTYWEGSIDASQYGITFGLDPKMFTDKKSPAYLLLNPVTGAIKELGTK